MKQKGTSSGQLSCTPIRIGGGWGRIPVSFLAATQASCFGHGQAEADEPEGSLAWLNASALLYFSYPCWLGGLLFVCFHLSSVSTINCTQRTNDHVHHTISGTEVREGGWEELLEIYVLTQVSVQRGDGGCWAAQCLHSPAYRARLCWKQWAQSSSIGHRSRVPCSPKPRTVLLRSKMSAPCSATPLMAAEEPRVPSVKFVRMSSRSLAEVSLIEAYTFRPLHLSFLFIGSTFLTFLFFCFTQLWCLACIIHGRK